MSRLIIFLAFLILAMPAWATPDRVAFLVGNAAYEHAPTLRNPVHDVDLIAKTLEGLGFEVSLHKDLTRREMAGALSTFLKETDGAKLKLFYFAGHGMQFEHRNYLIGVDAKLETEFDIESQALDLDRVVQLLERSGGASLVFVDACRNNPLVDQFYRRNYSDTRAVMSRGLARLQTAHRGAMITFSASPGQVALDGDEVSPFAKALADHLPTENVEVLSLMKRVIRDVKLATDDQQLPLVTNDLTQEIYLKLGKGGAGSSIAYEQEQAIFDAAMAIGTPRAWDLYFKRYPDGFFKDMALTERDRLQVASLAKDSGVDDASVAPGKRINVTRDVAAAAEKKLGLTLDDAKRVQAALNDRGYDAGAVDGQIGTRTRQAIADFQAAKNMPSTGVVTAATADALGIEVSNAESSSVAIVASQNARRYDPKQLALIEDDERLIRAAEVLEHYEYTYGFYDGRLYIAVVTWHGLDWAASNRLAKAAGGHLATVTSRAENAFVYSLIKTDTRFWHICGVAPCVQGPTFGLYQLDGAHEPDGGWTWVTDEPFQYANWQPFAPLNDRGQGEYGQFLYASPDDKPVTKVHTSDKWVDAGRDLWSILIEIE